MSPRRPIPLLIWLVASARAGRSGYRRTDDRGARRASRSLRLPAAVIAVALLAGCGVRDDRPAAPARGPAPALRPLKGDSPHFAHVLLRLDDLGEIRGRCAKGRPARLVYVDRARTGVDLWVSIGGSRAAHQVPTENAEAVGFSVPPRGRTRSGRTRYSPVRLVAFSTREPEEILARVELRLEQGYPELHPSGCDLLHARVDLRTRSHG